MVAGGRPATAAAEQTCLYTPAAVPLAPLHVSASMHQHTPDSTQLSPGAALSQEAGSNTCHLATHQMSSSTTTYIRTFRWWQQHNTHNLLLQHVVEDPLVTHHTEQL
jgi:hypothetical protein